MIPPGVEISGDPNEVWLIECCLPNALGWEPWQRKPALYDIEYSIFLLRSLFRVNYTRMTRYFRLRNVSSNEIIPVELFHD